MNQNFSFFEAQLLRTMDAMDDFFRASQVVLVVKNPPANAGNRGHIPGLERSPGEENGNLILAWRIPWAEESGWLLSIGLQGVEHDRSNLTGLTSLLSVQISLQAPLSLWFQLFICISLSMEMGFLRSAQYFVLRGSVVLTAKTHRFGISWDIRRPIVSIPECQTVIFCGILKKRGISRWNEDAKMSKKEKSTHFAPWSMLPFFYSFVKHIDQFLNYFEN